METNSDPAGILAARNFIADDAPAIQTSTARKLGVKQVVSTRSTGLGLRVMPSNGRSCLQKSESELRKFAWLLIAFGIAAYAIYGLMADDLVMPYRWGSGGYRGHGHTRLLHLHGMWMIGGSICLLLSAAGFVVLFLGALRVNPGTKPGVDPYRYLAAGLILVGSLFFLGVSYFAQRFVQ